MAFALAPRSWPAACAAKSSAHNAFKPVSIVRRPRSSLRVAAMQQQDSNTDSRSPQGSLSTLQSFQKSYDRFRQRYEQSILSAGVGALMVTTYCVLKGQSPMEAAGITACATVMALVSYLSYSRRRPCFPAHLRAAVSMPVRTVTHCWCCPPAGGERGLVLQRGQ